MRIISGILGGVVIHPPKGLPVRPTTDRAKESLFNILSNHFHFEQLKVLDLFSGTGNIAYECCSRGAQEVVAVDINFNCVQFIKQMKQQYKLDQLSVSKMDVFKYLRNSIGSFDLIFADAPYAHSDLVRIPGLVFEKQWLNNGGWLVVEHEVHLDLSRESGFFDQRNYGQSAFSFFKHNPEHE